MTILYFYVRLTVTMVIAKDFNNKRGVLMFDQTATASRHRHCSSGKISEKAFLVGVSLNSFSPRR